MRAFIAIELGPELTAACRTLGAEIAASLGPARSQWSFSKTGGAHVTLAFLGEIGAERGEGITAALAEAARSVAPFEVSLAGVGAFPLPRQARVLWVDVREGRAALTALAERVVRALEPLGFPAPGRSHQPHVTLARARSPRGADATGALAQYADARVGVASVRSIVFLKTEAAPAGVVHMPLATLALGPG